MHLSSKFRRSIVSVAASLALAAGLSVGIGLVGGASALGQGGGVGTSVTYQGQLKNNGVAVNSPADIKFSIFDAETGGTQIGTISTRIGVPVSQGLFSTTFDCGVNPYTADAARWLQIEVRNPSNVGGFVLLGSRQRLTAAPFSAATRGINVDGAGHVTVPGATMKIGAGVTNDGSQTLVLKRNNVASPGTFLAFQDQDSGVNYWNWRGDNATESLQLWDGSFNERVTFLQNGNVGIGINLPTDRLHVKGGRLRVDQTDGVGGSGVMVMSNGTTDNYVYTAAGTGDLVLDTQSPADNLILVPNGGSVGVGGGPATSDTRVTIHQGYTPLGTQRTNLFLSQPQCGWGTGAEFTNYRYIKTDACSNNEGFFKQFNVAPGGVSIGYPNTPAYNSTDAMYINGNVGIGTNTPSHKLTVQGDTNTMRLIGPTGSFQWNSRLNLGDADYVRISENDDDFLDLQGANGIRAANTFSAPAKNFRIDHPSDPANMILNHGCIESDQYVNLYRGNAIIGNDGGVWIQLPAWMNDLNTDFSYQLTSVGAAQPNLFVAVEVNNQNQFRVAGGQPGAKVSWQVTGVRHDAYVQAHPLVVEEVKTGSAAGTYLSPTSFGIYTAEELAKMGNRK